MSDGMSDAAREARISKLCSKGVELLEEAFEDGGYDQAFGLNGGIVRDLNEFFKKYGYQLKEIKVKT